MRTPTCVTILLAALVTVAAPAVAADTDPFTRLRPLAPPRIVAAAEEFPNGQYAPRLLFDGKPDTAYATNGKGTQTFVEFDFGVPTKIAAIRHVDRNDLATVAASEFVFSDAAGKSLGRFPVQHPAKRWAVTLFALPRPMVAQRVRWQVTKLGNAHAGCVGGSEMAFFTAEGSEATPRGVCLDARTVQIIQCRDGRLVQPLRVTLDSPYARPFAATLHVEGQPPRAMTVQPGAQTLEYSLPMIESPRRLELALDYGGQAVVRQAAALRAARKTTIYILAHSHTDIGYTELQSDIEDKQVNNLLLGMEYARRTANYPPGARFVWNVEVLWAADLYQRRLAPAQREAFIEAVRRGQVALCGMYLNELTGLCRNEELMRLFRMAPQLAERTGVPIDAAMISDVPGCTWGTVSAMAQAGIKYFSVGTNLTDRLGDVLTRWEDRPFYWLGPSGKDRVLVWVPYMGYVMSHVSQELSPALIDKYLTHLENIDYPYEVACTRWSGHGDNAVPELPLCDFVKQWSAQYEWPKLVIASASAAFRDLERRYGDQLPRCPGDWTPYWEDGANTSALETATNRASSDRLVQAETLWALRSPRTYPSGDFESAWRNVLLYSEHTWGAWSSVREPLRRETLQQWAVKQSYAVAADLQSRDLLSRATSLGRTAPAESAIDVVNTNSWTRTGLVTVPRYLADLGPHVQDDGGHPVASQRLASGELAFIARDVPPFGSRRYTLDKGPSHVDTRVTVTDNTLDNGLLRLRVDPRTGSIVELRSAGRDVNLADTASGRAINDYLYLQGDNPADAQPSGPAKISVYERGPLVASLAVECDAPGCYRLRREVRLYAGLDYVELVNVVDKRRVLAEDYQHKSGKEGLHFAFPFHVPGGQLRVEVPFGVVRPDADQLPSACKNWFTVGRWVDVSNTDFGVTCVTLDAPMVEVGAITANLLVPRPETWVKTIGPTQRFYSWVMSNHWHTNYRAFQEGPVVFRYQLRPHARYDAAEASRAAVAATQPLLAIGVSAAASVARPRLSVDSPHVLVTGLKPSDDGRALIVRLWEAGGQDRSVTLDWASPVPRSVSLSDLSENPQPPLTGAVNVPAWGVVTLRADLP